MSKGVELIAAERRRQVEAEGWSASHDHDHQDVELATAARCYLQGYEHRHDAAGEPGRPVDWPWEDRWWKPKNPIRDLVRAGALIAAEIDRINAALSPTTSAVSSEGET